MDRITKAVERAREEQKGRSASLSGKRLDGGKSYSGEPVKRVAVSEAVLKENRIITNKINSEYSQVYKTLRTHVWHKMRTHDWNTLAVTSSMPGEGKSLTAINLAINLALMEVDHTIILIDLDMRNPSVHRYFGLNPKFGVSDYLVTETPLDEIIVDPGIGRFCLIPGNIALPNSSEILSSPRAARLIDEIKARFPSNIIIFDMPPILLTDDVLVLSPYIDSTLLIIEEGKTQAKDASRAIEMLGRNNLMGTVLNKAEVQVQQYGSF